MSRPALLYLDFAAPQHRSVAGGVMLCIAGLAAAGAVGLAFQNALAERGVLDARLEALAHRHREPAPSAARNAALAETAKAARELTIPWTELLAELEAASHDMSAQVSLLGVEPDPDKRLVRITAEVHSLPDALAYLERLQQSRVLRYPMLESHERRKDDPEHPIRIKLAAEWLP